MKYFSLLALFALLAFAACEDDDTGAQGDVQATIEFRADFDETPLAIQSETYDYPGGEKLKVQLFQYYISDLELLPADGSTPVRLSDIELIQYMSATDDAIESRTYTIPSGTYTGLRFGLGVRADLNAMDPNNFAADYILNENEFWNASTRYVFAKIEANADLENDTTFDTPLTYHMGSDALYTTITFNQDFEFDGNGDPKLTVVADVLKAMASNGEVFDISNPDQQRVHGGNQAVATGIWNRLVSQFTLEVR